MRRSTDNADDADGSAFTRQLEFGTYVFWALLMLLLVLGTSCGPKAYPTSRPKFGDSTQPIGPDKSHFKHP